MPTCTACGYQGEGSYCASCGASYATGKPARARSGGAVIAIVIVVCFIGAIAFTGIVAAIAVPNLLNAVQRGKQKRTMADIRTVATALERRAMAENTYLATEGFVPLGSIRDRLEPTWATNLPDVDGWQVPLLYRGDESSYTLASGGKDGALEEPLETGPTTDFRSDIVFSDGAFVSWPEGSQS